MTQEKLEHAQKLAGKLSVAEGRLAEFKATRLLTVGKWFVGYKTINTIAEVKIPDGILQDVLDNMEVALQAELAKLQAEFESL